VAAIRANGLRMIYSTQKVIRGYRPAASSIDDMRVHAAPALASLSLMRNRG
jgi:hypothetical protein